MLSEVRKLKKKKYIALLSIIGLIITIWVILGITIPDKYYGLVKVKEANLFSKSLASVGNAVLEEGEIRGNSTIEYIVSFTLDELEGVETRDAVVTASLSDSESKYARFKNVIGTGISSVLADEGKSIDINVQDVTLGQEKKVKLKLVLTNAPNGFEIHPTIKVKESTGEYTSLETQNIIVSTNTLTGNVKDETGTSINNIELVLYKDGLEVKRTFTDSDGNYSVTDLETGTYKVDVDEDIYELSEQQTSEVSGSTRLDITVKRVEPYTIETHKYIEKVKLVVDGETKEYDYNDAEKVVEEIKRAKNISGEITYKLVVQNIGEKEGTITRVEDVASEGLSLKEENDGWEQVNDKYYFRPIEGTTLKSQEKVELFLVLNIDSTDEAKVYLNKMTAKGEIYEKVVYILNGTTYREDEILEGEYAENPNITTEGFDGWYTDKNKNNKYNFDNPVLKDIILYGFTESYKCTVTFMDFGQIYDQQVIDCGNKVTAPNDPVHEGYQFDKWLDENDYEFDPNEPIERDVTYTSKNDLINYNIRYNYNGGELPDGVTNPGSYNIETPDFTLNNPSKRGYNFIGWTEHDGDTPNPNMVVRKGSTGEKTFTAVYEAIPYTITYDLDGGSLAEGKTNPTTYTIETETFTLNNPSKEGYDFIGWTGTDLTENTMNVTVSKGTIGNRNYKANYRPKEYEIKYHGLTDDEVASLGNPKKYTIESETITIINPANRLDDDGDLSEIFTGWTGSNGDSQSTLVTIPKGSTGNKEFTAHFIDADPDVYPITYNLDGGTLAEGVTNPSSYTKKTETFTLSNPSKTGYDFIGWTGTDLSEITTTVTIEKGSRGERAYTAHYSPIEYPITYDLDGGSLAEGVTNPSTYTIETETFTLNNPTKKGYTFIGWTGTDVPSESTSVSIPKGSTGERSYTAVFTKDSYRITYELNGGTLAEGVTNPITYDVETPDITLNNPSKTGYNFVGWSGTDIIGTSTTVVIPTGSTGDRAYEAIFTPIEYRITYNLEGGALPEGVTNPTTYTIESPDITLNYPVKNEYRFTGWTGTDLTTVAKDVVIPTGSMGDREYTANYGINSYLVRFINLGNLYQQQRVNYNGKATRPSYNPSSGTNSVFKYWSLENKTIDENPAEYDFETPIVEDTNLYAVYEPVVAPEVSHTPTAWTNQNVTVTITPAKSEYNTFYYIDSDYHPTYDGAFEVEQNCTITAVSNYNNAYSDSTIHPITNIDKINPEINNLSASGVTTTEFTINVSAIDRESGIASIMLYKDDVLVGTFEYDDEDTGEKINSYTLSNLEQNTSYKISAKAIDKATNESIVVEKEFSTGEPVVARIIGEDNTMWEEENWINFSSLQAAIEYGDCVSTQCTIQMVTGTNESNIILNGQDITLDLNGQIVRGVRSDYTIQNNGLFTLVDNSNEKGVLYNSYGTALLNSNDQAVLTLGVNDLDYNVSTEQPRVVGASYGVKKEAGLFNFYDGYIEGVSAIYGIVDDTPYLYNARISSIVTSDEAVKQKAILNIVADAEARIGTVYYTKLSDAIDQSKVGTIDATETIETFANAIETYGDYGFSYNDNHLVPDVDHVGESYSIIPIDLTNAEEDKILFIGYKLHETRYDDRYNYYYNDYDTSINITDEYGTYNEYSYAIFSSAAGTYYYGDNNLPNQKLNISLQKGRKYYVAVKGNVDITELSLGVETIKYLSEYEDLTLDNNALVYGFEYDEETKTYRSNNNYQSGTVAFDYMEIDLTNKNLDYVLNVAATLDTVKGRSDYGVVRISEDNIRAPYYSYMSSSERLIYLYSGNDYNVSQGNRSFQGPILGNRILEKGKKYYLQFYYFKESSTYPKEAYDGPGSNDEFIINNVEIYPVEPTPSKTGINLSTSMVTPGDYGYTNNNNRPNVPQSNYGYVTEDSTAHSYVVIDLTNTNRKTVAQMNVSFSKGNGVKYIAATTSPDKPSLSDAFISTENSNFNVYDSSNIGGLKIPLKEGEVNYLHFVGEYITGDNTNDYIYNLNLEYDEISLYNEFLSVANRGYDFDSNGYRSTNYVDKQDIIDSYIPVDLTNSNTDKVLMLDLELYSYSPQFFIYITDNERNLSYQDLMENRKDMVYHAGPYTYFDDYYNYIKRYVYLEKGKKYYVHVANTVMGYYSANNYNYSGAYIRQAKLLNPIESSSNVFIGQKKIFHGTQLRTDSILEADQDNAVRFVGKTAGNYIKFNNEQWRIIGVFNTEDENGVVKPRIKIVRNNSIGNYPIDSTREYNNNSGYGINEWSQADAMKLLNPGYDDESVGGSLYWNSESGNCYTNSYNSSSECDFSSTGLTSAAKEYIDEVVWYTGAHNISSYTPLDFYNAERGNETGKENRDYSYASNMDDLERTTRWTGKVGLIYPSDYKYSVGDYKYTDEETGQEVTISRSDCMTSGNNYANSCYTYSSWIGKMTASYPIYSITPNNGSASNAYMLTAASTYAYNAMVPFEIIPTLYLSNKTVIDSGSGTSTDPYVIRLGSSVNTDNDYGLAELNENYNLFIRDETDDHNYRFIGEDPNNYISFNNELWRIVGVFKTEDKNGNESYRIKIIRSSSIGRYSWDSSKSSTNAGYGINDWNQSDMMKLLNSGYEDNTEPLFSYNGSYSKTDKVNNSLYWNRSDGNCIYGSKNYYSTCYFSSNGLLEESKPYIDTVKWNTGAIINENYGSLSPNQIYEYEHGNATGKTDLVVPEGFPLDDQDRHSTWVGKVGLPSVSDYIMASGAGLGTSREVCMTTSNYGDCSSNNNWMSYSVSGLTAGMSAAYGTATSTQYQYMTGASVTLVETNAVASYYIRPAVYLSTKVQITGGNGTESNPYTISLGDSDNEQMNNYYGLYSGSAPDTEPMDDPIIDKETDDYKKLKHSNLYGFTYDEDTHTFTNDNYADVNSVASTTVEIDLTNESFSKRFYYNLTNTDSYYTFFIINENPDPINYNSSYSTCYSGGMNCNITGSSGQLYLDPGKKYYLHLGYINAMENSNTGNLFTATVRIDAGEYKEEAPEIEKVVERNSDIDTIQVLKNINLDYYIDIEEDRSVKIDLNGYTLTSLVSGNLVRNKGDLEILDSKVDTENPGKIINNNGNVIVNNVGANLTLTSGRVDTNNSAGVKNLGTMTMKEDFTINGKSYGIDNTDGVIEDVAGNIIGGTTGIYNNVEATYNGEDSGKIKQMTGPLNISNGTYCIQNTDILNNATLACSYGVYNENIDTLKVDNSILTSTTAGIYSPESENVEITNSSITNNSIGIFVKTTKEIQNTDISSSSLGIRSEELTKLKDVNVTSSEIAIAAGLDDETMDFENVVTDSAIAIDLLSGNLTVDDNIPLEFTGGFINNGNMTINLVDKDITRGISPYHTVYYSSNSAYNITTSPCVSEYVTFNILNNGTMDVINLPNDNLSIQNAGTLTGADLTINEFGACGNSVSTLNSIDSNRLKVNNSSSSILSKVDYTNGSIKSVDNYAGTYPPSTTSSPYENYSEVNLTNLTIGDDDTTTEDVVNSGQLNITNSTITGQLVNKYYGNVELDNSNVDELNNNGYHYYYWYSTYSGTHYYYYYGKTNVNIKNNSTIRTITNGTTPSNYTSSSYIYYRYNDNIYIDDSSVTGTTLNYPTGIIINKSGEMSDITNGGSLTLGDKEDESVNKNIPSTEKITNTGNIYFYDGIVRSNEEYPISGEGDIKEVAEGYYLYKDTEDGTNVMYLMNDKAICKIGNVTYPSIGSALASIPENSEKVTIDVLQSHVTAEKLVNEKNATIDLHGFVINEYNGEYITNNGDLSIISTDSKGKLLHSDRDYVVLQNTGQRKGQNLGKKIVNKGTFEFDNIESWSIDFSNDVLKDDNDRILQTGTASISNAYFYNIDNLNEGNRIDLDSNTVEYITNYGYLHGASNYAFSITNYKDIEIDSNRYLAYYPSYIITYNTRTYEHENLVWIKAGKYDYIVQKNNSSYDQLVQIGTPDTSVIIVMYAHLTGGIVKMYNTTINATEPIALEATGYGSNSSTEDRRHEIHDSSISYEIYYRDSNVTTKAVSLTGGALVDRSTVTCFGSNVSKSNYCNGISAGTLTLNDSSVTAYDTISAGYVDTTNSTITAGHNAYTVSSELVMNSGTVNATNYGVQSACGDIYVVDGTFDTTSHVMYLYDTSSCYNRKVYVGTNKDKTVIGNPTLTSTTGGGLYSVSGGAEILFANGTITSVANSIYGIPRYNSRTGAEYPITINIGTVDLENVDENPVAINNGVEYTGIYLNGSDSMYQNNYINIQKGSITSDWYAVKISAGRGVVNLGVKGDEDVSKVNPYLFSTTTAGISVPTYGTINFYDGVIKGKIGGSIVGTVADKEDGFILVNKQESGYELNYLDNPKLAAIGSTEYDTLQDAIDHAENGDTIKLLTDYQYIASMEPGVIPEGKSIILDFDGKIVTQKVNGKIYLTNNGTLELKNVGSSGTINFVNNGDLTYTSGGTSSINNTGNITIVDGTVSVTKGDEVDTDNVIVQGGTVNSLKATNLTVNAGTINDCYSYGTSTINDGTIKNYYTYGITTINTANINYLKVKNGTTTSNNATIKSITITDGTLNLLGGTVNSTLVGIYVDGGELNIGTNDGVVDTTSPEIIGSTVGISYSTSDAVVNFYDGYIKGNTSPLGGIALRNYFNSVESGYIAVDENKTIKLKQTNIIKNVDTGTEYDDIQTAINNASDGDTLQLLKGVVPSYETENYTIPSGKNITFDYNGNNIYSKKVGFVIDGGLELTSTDPFTSSKKLHYLNVTNNGEFTIDNFVIDGEVTINNTSGSTATINNITSTKLNLNNEGTTDIDSYTISDLATINNSGTLTLDGCSSTNVSNINNSGTLNIKNVTSFKTKINTNTGTVTLDDSTFTSFDITNNNNLVVNNVIFNNPVIKNNSSSTIDFNSGQLKNLTNSSNFKNSGTMNFNGLTMSNVIVSNDGTINILTGEHYLVKTTGYGTVNIKDSKITDESSSNYSHIIANNVNIENSYLTGVTVRTSANIKDMEEGKLLNLFLSEGTVTTIDNSYVYAELEGSNIKITANNNTNLYLYGKAIMNSSNKYVSNRLDGLEITANDSTIERLSLSQSCNVGSNPYDINVNLYNSTLKDIDNKSYYYDVTYTRPSYRVETVYEEAAHVNVYAEDSTIDSLDADSLEMKNGTLTYGFVSSHTAPSHSSLPTSCKFDNTTIGGKLSCGTVELKSSDVPNDVYSDVLLTAEDSTITGNLTGDGNFEFTDSTVDGSVDGKNVTITNSSITHGLSANNVTMNSGTVSDGINASTSVTILSGTVNNSSGTAITAPNVTIGSNDDSVNTADPVITGDDVGISTSYLYFYDGTITGTQATDTSRAYYPAGYKMDIISVSGNQILTLTPIGQDEVVADTDNKFYVDIQSAINDCVDGGTVRLHRDITLTSDVIISSDKSIIIDLNNHVINNIERIQGNYTIKDSTQPEIGGALYRFLANLLGEDPDAKNIVIYQMEDGEKLSTEETYKLYRLENSEYKIVNVNEEELGEYTIGNNSETMNVIKGKLYLNGIGPGTYKLVSNRNREIDFDIYDDGVSSNIRINNSLPSAKVISSSFATLILTFSTGIVRTPWMIMLVCLILLLTLLFIVNNKKKTKESN